MTHMSKYINSTYWETQYFQNLCNNFIKLKKGKKTKGFSSESFSNDKKYLSRMIYDFFPAYIDSYLLNTTIIYVIHSKTICHTC